LSESHVAALNAIPIEFYGEKQIIESWKIYFDHMLAPDATTEVWFTRFNDLFVDLIHFIAQHLKYDFSRVEIAKEVYAPKAHGTIQSDQEVIRRGLAEMFTGKFAIPMELKSVPTNEGMNQEQEAIRKALLKWLAGENAVTVALKERAPEPNEPAARG